METETSKFYWKQLQAKDPPPMARSSHSLTCIGTKLYIFGGEHEPRVPIDNTLHCYDLVDKVWAVCSFTSNPPCPRIAHTSAAVDSRLYIFGGRTGITDVEGCLNDLYCFDTLNGTWSKVDGTNLNNTQLCSRSFHSMTTLGRKLYIFGGCGPQGRLNDLNSFDTDTLEWEEMPTNMDIIPRGGAGLVGHGTSLYVIGGFCGQEMGDVHKYETVTKTWTAVVPDSPTGSFPARSVFGVTSLGSFILVFGGEIDPSETGHEGAGQFSNDIFRLNAVEQNGVWDKVECKGDAPLPRGWFAMATNKDGIFVFGGNSVTNERLNDLHQLVITE